MVIRLNTDCAYELIQKDTACLADIFAANWSPKVKETVANSFVTMVGVRILRPDMSQSLATSTACSYPDGHGRGHLCGFSLGLITHHVRFEPGHRLEFPNVEAALLCTPRGFSTFVEQIVHANFNPTPQMYPSIIRSYPWKHASEHV